MKLYLVRHAIAGLRDPDVWPDDTLRPLTPKGSRRFRQAARGLKRVVSDVDLVLSSPSVRAWDTAMILSEEAGWPEPIDLPELQSGEPGAVLRALMPYAHCDSLAVVGHEPYLGRLAGSLLSTTQSPSLEFKKGAVACLRLAKLSNVAPAELLWLLPPRVMRSLR